MTWYCAVTVATVWTSPESVREIDREAAMNPVRLKKWLENLSYGPRLDLCDSNRIQTQILYGEPVIVEEIIGVWAKVIAVWQSSRKDDRGYPGWVPLFQLKKAAPIRAEGFAKVIATKAQLWKMAGTLSVVIPFNAILPYVEESGAFMKVCTPDGDALILKSDVACAPSIFQFDKRPMSDAVEKGLSFLDLPYLWAGMSSYGYDCSGFIYNMLKACGYFIPRDASDQALGGNEVKIGDVKSWEKGDLLFFAHDEGRGLIHHVGFYFGNGIMLHSPSTGQSVELLKLEGSKYENKLCVVRRYGDEEMS